MTKLSDTSSAFALSPSSERVYWTSMPIHRLVAVAEYGFDAVTENDVSHKNGIRFDNRPENIEINDKISTNGWEEYADKNYRDKNWLRFQIENKDRAVSAIAEECDVTNAAIHIYINKFDIDYKHLKSDKYAHKKYRDEQWLRREKEEKTRSITDIAEECDVTNQTIRNYLDKFGLDRGKRERKYHEKAWLKERIEERDMSVKEVAEEASVMSQTIRKWLKKNDLDSETETASPGLMNSFNVS